MLKEQQNLLSNAECLNSNLFEITENNEAASTKNNLIDPSDSEDDLIDIKKSRQNLQYLENEKNF